MLVILAFNIPTLGQNIVKITLSQSVEWAQKNHLSVQQNKNQVQTSQIQLQQSKNEALPNVNATVSEFFNFGRSIDPFTNTFLSKNINYNNLDLNASIIVYKGGSLKKTVLQNEILLKASEQDLEAIKQDIALQVVAAYLSTMKAEDQLEVAKKQIEQTDLQIDKIEKLIKAGALPESNLLELQAQKATEQTSIINAESGVIMAKLTLKQLINEPNLENIDIERTEIALPQKQKIATPYQITELAYASQPNIQAAELRIKSAEKEIEIAKTNFLPTIQASANWGANQSNAQKNYSIVGTEEIKIGNVKINNENVDVYRNQAKVSENGTVDYLTQLKNTNNYGFGIQANIPIFSKFSNKNRLTQSQILKENAILQAQQSKQQLRQNIEQACTNLSIAQKTYEGVLVQQNTQEASFKATESKYNAGAVDFVNFQFQKNNLEKAKINLIQAKYEYLFRSKIVDFYQNKPLNF